MDIENRLVVARERELGERQSGRLGLADASFSMDRQQDPTVLQREPYSIFCDKL